MPVLFRLAFFRGQVWRVLLAYVSLCRRVSPAAHDAALSLALRLPFLPPAADYPTDALSSTEKRALADYTEWFGLAYQRKPNSRRFYATPHSMALLASPGEALAAGGARGGAAGQSGAVAAAKNAGELWPLHNIVITNSVWCMAYKREVEGGGVYCAMVVQ